MSLAAQVWHLLRFDLLRLRWVIAACGAVLTLSVVSALDVDAAVSRPREFLPYASLGVLAIAAVFAVQGDSPLRPSAFWRGQATRPLALLLSKVVLIGALFVMLPLVVAGATIVSYGVPLSDAVDAVAPAARNVAMWVAVCALVAVSTTEFTSAVVLFLAALIVFAGLMKNLGGPASDLLKRTLPGVPLLSIFLSIGAVIVVTYLRGMPRRVTLAVAAFLTGLGIFSLTDKRSSLSVLSLAEQREPAPYSTPPTLLSQPESLQVDSASLAGGTRFSGAPIVDVSLARATPGKLYELSWGLLTVTFANGDSVGVSLKGGIANPQVRQLLTLPGNLKMRPGPPLHERPRAALAVLRNWSTYVRLGANTGRRDSVGPELRDEMPAIQKRIRTDSVAAIRVDLMLDRFRQTDLATLPLNGVPQRKHPRLRLSFSRRVATEPNALAVDWSMLVPTRADDYGWTAPFSYPRPFMFVLQNADRGEAVLLSQGNVVSDLGAVVLPGIPRRSAHFDLDGVDGAYDNELDDAWLQRATLRVVGWEREGRVFLSTKYVLPRR